MKATATATIMGLVLVIIAMVPVYAQSGCTGDPCVFSTPTISPTPTTAATVGAGTPTTVPLPDAVEFPQPNYEVPTAIPTLSWPALPTPYSPPTLSLPTISPGTTTAFSTPVISLATAVPLITINTVISVSLITPSVLITSPITPTGWTTNTNTLLGNIVSYTNYISGQIATMETSNTITVVTAPGWYAPDLPRDMANIGWTFEMYSSGIDAGTRYSILSWAGLGGHIVSMPIRLAKSLWGVASYFGPVGLFLAWLFIMLGLVLFIRLLRLLYNIIFMLIDLLVRIIELLGEYLPTGG